MSTWANEPSGANGDSPTPSIAGGLLQAAVAAAALAEWPCRHRRKRRAMTRRCCGFCFSSAETSFDPARISDLYSRAVTAHIFEALYAYDMLARPTRVRPLTALGMPEVSDDFRVWTVRIKPGIHFADDPAFKGKPRELVAQDYVYAFQRVIDPANISPIEPSTIDLKIKGLAAVRDAAVKSKKPFDYDALIDGLRAIDRHTLRFELEEPRPRFIDQLTASDLLGAQAREVVEFYGNTIGEHPVGTGPFKLKSWRRSSRIVLERNPGYREVLYDAQPAADDAEGQAILAKLKGRRLPMIDEVDVAIIEEFQPQWLSFLNKQVDALATSTGHVPSQFANEAAPGASSQRGWRARAFGCTPTWRPTTPSPTSTCWIPPSAATRPPRWPCAAQSALHTTCRPRSGRSVAPPRGAGAVAGGATHQRLRPAFQERDERLRPGACAGACSTCTGSSIATAMDSANGPTAQPLVLQIATEARADLPRLQRAVAKMHGRDRPEGQLQHGSVA